jgi:uncharacterized protein
MLINDKVYGKFNITSPVILELINTKAFQRLKGICQTGIPNKYSYKKSYSRYEHSIGVYILLTKLGASEEEQVAGLLHDISHTAFSHIIDWVLGSTTIEDYQDNRHLSVIEQNELANILNKYGYSPKYIADYHRYKLLDSDIPNLCADRIDYSLREFPKKIRDACINGLSVINGEIIFTDITKAHLFAKNFLKIQIEHWAGYESATRYVILSELLREAIKDTAISLEDLLKTDRIVINKLIKTQNKKYLEILDMLKNKDLGFLEKSTTPSKKKFRYVDPKILIDKEIKKLSEIDKGFESTIKQAKENNLIGVFHGVLKLSN